MSKKTIEMIFRWGPVVFWMVVIFAFSHQPVLKVSEFYWTDFIFKKTAHLAEYFILTVLSYRAFNGFKFGRDMPRHVSVMVILITIFYAVSDEIHQTFIPGREGTLRDVLIDAGGGAIALWSTKNLLPKMPERLKKWVK